VMKSKRAQEEENRVAARIAAEEARVAAEVRGTGTGRGSHTLSA
jgi:hypothetical protein